MTARLRRAETRRITLVVAGGLVLVAALSAVALSLGAAALTPAEVWSALTGTGSRIATYVVWDVRMPRATAAVVVGAALGLAGAVFQVVLRNPLASPDVLGVTASAGAVGVFAVLTLTVSGLTLTGFVVIGGVASAALIGALAWRRGIHAMRLVLVGVGVSALASAVTGYLLTVSDLRDVSVAFTWLVGNLGGAAWPVVGSTGIVGLLGVLALAAQRRGLRALELDDATATALGFRVERVRIGVLATAVVLAAVAVSAAGPIGFVALVAPQLARRIGGVGPLSLWAAAAVGAALVSAADLLGQYAVPGVDLPVGVVTGIVGAPYLVWLLARGTRTRPGGLT
ncbi:FecCD family ABC transporter permease [Microbacterium sp. S16(2024)]|jgi:iron complex transport system permease protein|uniref:FecCD family ABC transporter permease n=1 Tax=Microbacterium sp. S16(2024) TaxID=3368601 RepID=UPI00373FA9A6